MRLSMSTQTKLVCLSPLTEPFSSPVEWDYPAGGEGDGAGKKHFVKSQGSALTASFLQPSALLHEFILCECQIARPADGAALAHPLQSQQFSRLISTLKCNQVKFNLTAANWGVLFRSYGAVAHPLSRVVVCIDKWLQQINVKRHVNHHPLTLQLHHGAVGHQSCFLFSAPTAGLPAGAAGLTDREVTTRGQSHVVFCHAGKTKRRKGAFQGEGRLY